MEESPDICFGNKSPFTAMNIVLLALLAGLRSFTYAFSETTPLLAWSNTESTSIDALPSNPAHTSILLEQILLNEDVCALDATILISQHGVRLITHPSR